MTVSSMHSRKNKSNMNSTTPHNAMFSRTALIQTVRCFQKEDSIKCTMYLMNKEHLVCSHYTIGIMIGKVVNETNRKREVEIIQFSCHVIVNVRAKVCTPRYDRWLVFTWTTRTSSINVQRKLIQHSAPIGGSDVGIGCRYAFSAVHTFDVRSKLLRLLKTMSRTSLNAACGLCSSSIEGLNFRIDYKVHVQEFVNIK